MATATAAARTPALDSPAAPLLALERVLDELITVLLHIGGDTYRAAPMKPVSGSVGQHVRHILDHVAAYAAATPADTLSYDRRERGSAVEHDPAAALRQVFRLKAALLQHSTRPLDAPVRVVSTMSTSGELLEGWSTMARELAFVLQHTIHHQAIIALLLAIQGVGTPERFGYAPSTPQG